MTHPTRQTTHDATGSQQPARRVVIRMSGEVTTKARMTRRFFVKRLADNLRDALKAEEAGEARVVRHRDRLIVHLGAGASAEAAKHAAQTACRVFGVQSASPGEEFHFEDPESLVRIATDFFGEAVRGRRFAVRARRVGDRGQIPIDGRALERELGTALLEYASGVDLRHPEVTAHLEITVAAAFLFHEVVAGPGGLPLGVEGRAVALVSGGFDSAVAAWLLMKRGVALDYVFCNLGGEAHQRGTLRVMKHVADRWSYGTRPRFHAIDFDPVSQAIQSECTGRFWQIVLKRLFLQVAEDVAREKGAVAIVTGDSLGQVSSQTLINLAAISEAVSMPVLRPLVGSNKEEIIQIAREIGTHDLSKGVAEYCALVPTKPATAATLAQARAEEARFTQGAPDARERAVAERSVLDLRGIDLSTADDASLRTKSIAAGDTVIDLRSKTAYQNWHFPDALYLEFPNALRAYASFDPKQRYVLYCEIGLKSAHLAELMRKAGLVAAHFEGGMRGLLGYAREHGVALPGAGNAKQAP